MQKFIYLIILSFLSKSAICQNNESFFPMAVGNYWEYSWDDGLGGRYLQYEKIISKVLKPNGMYYYTFQSEYSRRPGYYNYSYYRMDDSNNTYRYIDYYNKEFLSEKFSAKTGESWFTGRLGYLLDPKKMCDSAFLKRDTREYINGKNNLSKIISYHSVLWIETIQFVKGVGIYQMFQEAYTRVDLRKYHIVLDIKERQNRNISSSFQLFSNYPNPFNPSTSIKCILNNQSTITLKIFNTNGQLIKTLHEGNLDAGEHTFIWNGRNEKNLSVSSGIYYYTLNIYNNRNMVYSDMKRMILIK